MFALATTEVMFALATTSTIAILIALGAWVFAIFLHILASGRECAATEEAERPLPAPRAESTELPIPPAAYTCSHQWEVQTQERAETDLEVRVIAIMTCPHCGAIDKTIETVPKKHDWELVETNILPSAYEQWAQAATKYWTQTAAAAFQKENTPPSLSNFKLFEKKIVIVKRCRRASLSNCSNHVFGMDILSAIWHR